MDNQEPKRAVPEPNKRPAQPIERKSTVLQPSETFVQEIKSQSPAVTTTPVADTQQNASQPTATTPELQTPNATAGQHTETTSAGLTGSQIPEEKVKLPIGIYLIAGFNLIGFVVSFFDTSQNSAIYSLTMLVDLLLAIGLLLRLEIARKIII